ncbi:hypothetical protein B0H14DRAFT_2590776 [Mycena olivaceomarginata]|nr:hypothetical protein B0H14DRAFT_2590776 [Mycena olivaceomarginata]
MEIEERPEVKCTAWATQLWDPTSSPIPRPVLAAFAAQPERAVRHAQPHALVPALLRPPLPAPAHSPRKTEFGPPLPVGERARGRARDEQHGHGPKWEWTKHEHDPRVQPPRSFGAAAPSTEEREATVRSRRRSSTRAEEAEFEQDGATRDASRTPTEERPPAAEARALRVAARQQANSSRKLNVAQAAKEAGQEYASLSEEEKEPYKRRSQAAKDVRELALASYMRTLTPDDIKRENAFRAAQRKVGKHVLQWYLHGSWPYGSSMLGIAYAAYFPCPKSSLHPNRWFDSTPTWSLGEELFIE